MSYNVLALLNVSALVLIARVEHADLRWWLALVAGVTAVLLWRMTLRRWEQTQQAVQDATKNAIWADVLTVASSALQRQQGQRVDRDLGSR